MKIQKQQTASVTGGNTPKVALTAQTTAPRIYLDAEETARLLAACKATELGQAEMIRKLVRAGLLAVESEHYKFTLPLRFAVIKQ